MSRKFSTRAENLLAIELGQLKSLEILHSSLSERYREAEAFRDATIQKLNKQRRLHEYFTTCLKQVLDAKESLGGLPTLQLPQLAEEKAYEESESDLTTKYRVADCGSVHDECREKLDQSVGALETHMVATANRVGELEEELQDAQLSLRLAMELRDQHILDIAAQRERVKRLRSADMHTRRVPDEVLLQIFLLCSEQQRDNLRETTDRILFGIPHPIPSIAVVSKRWRFVALSNPILWQPVVIGDSLTTKQIKGCLDLHSMYARNLSLHIVLNTSRDTEESWFEDFQMHLRKVKIESYTVYEEDQSRYFNDIVIPNCASLHLYQMDGTYIRIPSVSHLTLTWSRIHFYSMKNNLESLDIGSSTVSPSLDRLLVNSPGLRRLRFLDAELMCEPQIDISSRILNGQALTKLETFEIQCIHLYYCGRIINHILRLPTLRNFVIHEVDICTEQAHYGEVSLETAFALECETPLRLELRGIAWEDKASIAGNIEELIIYQILKTCWNIMELAICGDAAKWALKCLVHNANGARSLNDLFFPKLALVEIRDTDPHTESLATLTALRSKLAPQTWRVEHYKHWEKVFMPD